MKLLRVWLCLTAILALTKCGESRQPVTKRGDLSGVSEEGKPDLGSTSEVAAALLGTEESITELDTNLTGLDTIQTQMANLESQLAEAVTPAQYSPLVIQLEDQHLSREQTVGRIEDSISASTLVLEQQRTILKNLALAIERGDSEETLAKISDLTVYFTDLTAQLAIKIANYEVLTQEFGEYQSQLVQDLETTKLIGDGEFAYDNNNPSHFRSLCNGSPLDQMNGRSGLLVDQVVISCGGVANGAVGGNGGDPLLAPLTCPETHVAKGIFGGAGDSLDGVGLICTPKDDLDSESILKTEGLGNPEGGTPFEYFCPARTQLIGIGGTLNSPESFLSRIFPYCAKLPEQGALATNQK